jgi:hypothetical protein
LRRAPKAARTAPLNLGHSATGTGGAPKRSPTKALSTFGGGTKLPARTRASTSTLQRACTSTLKPP